MPTLIDRLFILYSVLRPAIAHKHGHDAEVPHSGNTLSQVVYCLQEYLFPFTSGYNAILATLIIQLAPCFVIYSIPGLKKGTTSNEDSILLPILVAFAFGTLLGDIFLHLIPEVFQPDASSGGPAQLNLVLQGSATFAGFVLFLFLDKTLRVLSIGSGQSASFSTHSHSHSHHAGSDEEPHGTSVDVLHEDHGSRTLRQRKIGTSTKNSSSASKSVDAPKQKTGISAYLTIITGCVHNITDGIALASSFYSSKHIGVTTTIAVMFHEIPHELGDFVILLSSGFTFPQALKSQLVTSVGAIIGTLIGCALNEFRTSTQETATASKLHWLMKLNQTDLLLPVSTGGFLYIVTVGVAPQVLQNKTSNKTQEAKIWALQLISIAIGFGMMAILALLE